MSIRHVSAQTGSPGRLQQGTPSEAPTEQRPGSLGCERRWATPAPQQMGQREGPAAAHARSRSLRRARARGWLLGDRTLGVGHLGAPWACACAARMGQGKASGRSPERRAVQVATCSGARARLVVPAGGRVEPVYHQRTSIWSWGSSF